MNQSLQLSLKWEQQQRLTMLEATVFWSGEVSTSVLTGHFGISRIQASKDLTLYQSLCPTNLRYDKSLKRYVIGDAFKSMFMVGTAAEFLQVLKIQQNNSGRFVVALAENLPVVELIEPVFRKMDQSILRTVNQAIVHSQEIHVTYQSMSNNDPKDYFLSPHALVFDGLRWHMRAFSRGHSQFRDFVLSRILQAEVVGKALREKGEDLIWNTYVEVLLAPHPGLTEHQRTAIEFDYAMVEGVLKYKVRAALLNYFLQVIKIGPDDLQRPANVQQIVLLNRTDLANYLW